MVRAYLNHIKTAVPPYDIHGKFVDFAPRLLDSTESRWLFRRMVARSQIRHRYSFLKPHEDEDRLDADGFYDPDVFPDTAARMVFYHRNALSLACRALEGIDPRGITHLIITTCTGFFAPGLDLEIVQRYGLKPDVERTVVGFMGCHAALHGLKLARHIVRSVPSAKVLVLNLELCTIHLKRSGDLQKVLSFLLFGDGCAASLISAEAEGIELQSFHAGIVPGTAEHITWGIGRTGFDMVLSGQVPRLIATSLPAFLPEALGSKRQDVTHWAVHPGGRSILDAVQDAVGLSAAQMSFSRAVLAEYGNMSSPTIMFVLKGMMEAMSAGSKGCALAFGPGLAVEAMRFEKAGR